MDRQLIYKLISNIAGIHLGVADKFLINRMIIEKNYTGLEDIFAGSREMLTCMGYESKKLIEMDIKIRVHHTAIAEEALRKYNLRKTK
jgi:hypothetical protein